MSLIGRGSARDSAPMHLELGARSNFQPRGLVLLRLAGGDGGGRA
jgi:hypothetical protein